MMKVKYSDPRRGFFDWNILSFITASQPDDVVLHSSAVCVFLQGGSVWVSLCQLWLRLKPASHPNVSFSPLIRS